MQSYFGKIQIRSIRNTGISTTTGNEQLPVNPLEEQHIRYVHYPDCQQLIIWLPVPGREYGYMRLLDLSLHTVLEEYPVAEQLNGSVQLLRDTLPLPPGIYAIEIDRKDGWQHRVELEKFEPGKEPVPQPEELPVANPDSPPIVYRDGLGNVLPNEDLLLREKLNRDLLRKFGRKLEYSGNFRAGTIIYSDGENRLEFYHEMGGGDCMFYVDIPGKDKWEKQTGLPLAQREEIIQYLAATVQSQQAPSARYEIRDNCIIYFNQ